jgi:hypothetical protein
VIRTLLTLSLVAVATPPGVLASDSPQIRAPAPVRNFSLPFFNNEGHRTMLIRGNEARLTDPRRPRFVDMTLSLFTGDASNTIETIILSTEATVDTTTKTMEGTGPVRLVRDDIEVTGERWFYDYNDPDTINLRIERKARIVFRAELQSLLK